jgi:S-adenosylmethionine/arginine decarboxylase-like enzyme
MSWGYHLILDCYDADKSLITSKTNIEAFAIALVRRIDMVAYGEPQVIHFGEDDKAGYTLVQLIETSGNFYLDVFSCKPYSVEAVLETVNQFFAPKKIRERYIERD